ncbi:methyl-accepting chemotaxis protein [Fulvimarina sp. MAC3]
MSIGGRIKLLIALMVAAFSAIGAIAFIESQILNHSADDLNKVQTLARDVAEMRIEVIRITLAAMDTIVDKAEGTIEPERREIMMKGVSTITSLIPMARELAQLVGETNTVDGIEAKVEALRIGVLETLPRLIEERANEEAFGEIDDVIDNSAGVLRSDLATLSESAFERLQDTVDASRQNTTFAAYLQVGSALAGLLVLVSIASMLSRSIAGSLRSLEGVMSEISNGHLKVDIKGAERRDEIGSMARALQVFKEQAIERDRLEHAAEESRRNEVLAKERQAAIESSKAEDLRVLVTAVEASFDRLSDGDLTIRMNQKLAPEFEPIRVKFNDSVAQLEEAIGGVVSSVETIRTGLSEIAIASNDLSHRTEQQAASIEETVAALSDVSRAVAVTADNAGKARETARSAASKAEEGGAIVGRAVSAMEEIEDSSQKINDIIGVIDEIAFQTNLLALNAGVEAARAGEAGKGFAVVAQEVRELAQRSAGAAREIKGLISTSRERVGTGVDLVTASGRSLEEIVAEVNAMSQVISAIAASANEQASSLREVTGAADQMDKVTQQNAAMVEETTAATKNVEAETDALSVSVSRFSISGGDFGSSRPSQAEATTRPAAKPAGKPSVAVAGERQKPVASPVHALQERIAKKAAPAPKRAAPVASNASAVAANGDDWTEF